MNIYFIKLKQTCWLSLNVCCMGGVCVKFITKIRLKPRMRSLSIFLICSGGGGYLCYWWSQRVDKTDGLMNDCYHCVLCKLSETVLRKLCSVRLLWYAWSTGFITAYHHIKTLILFADQENIPARVGVPGAVREERYSLRWTIGLLLVRATSSNSPFATNLAHAHMSRS
jgi:hypothetical protein